MSARRLALVVVLAVPACRPAPPPPPEPASGESLAPRIASGEVSLLDFVPASLHAGIRHRTNTTDLSAYVQAAIDRYADADAPAARIHVPPGEYRLEHTIVLKGHQVLAGDLGDRNLAGNPGSEFVWAGPDGGTAFITSTDDDSDWSRAGIENVAIENVGARREGWGLKVRNPQNGAYLRHVFVRGFPTSQVLAYEPGSRRRTRGGTPGSAPGYWSVEDLLAIGGRVPVEIEVGVEPTEIRQLGVGTDATSTVGVLLHRSALGQPQRAPIVVTSSFVEIAEGSGDIDGFAWSSDLAVTFVGSAVQRNGTSPPSTKAAFRYLGKGRNVPTAELVNCTSWRMHDLYAFDAAALAVRAAEPSVPESFGFARLHTDGAFAFSRDDVGPELEHAALRAPGSMDSVVMHRAGTIVGVSARLTEPVARGGAVLRIVKNGVRPVRAVRIEPPRQSAAEDFTRGEVIDHPDFHFVAGDRVGVELDTDGAFAPAGGHVLADVFVSFR